jgi:hypothetical protein
VITSQPGLLPHRYRDQEPICSILDLSMRYLLKQCGGKNVLSALRHKI